MALPPPPVTNGIEITTIAGPPFVVLVTNWALFGVLSIQVYIYSQAFPNDRPILKALVYGVTLIEMAQTFLLTQTGWAMLVQGFGNVEAINEVGTTFISVPFIGGLVGLLVQLFYAWRIAIISHKKIIPVLIFFISLTSFAGAIITTVNGKQAGKFSEIRAGHKLLAHNIVGVWGGASSFCDVVIAVCMCYYLRKKKGFASNTHALVSRLVKMTIETGVLTASVSIVSLILCYSAGLRNFSYLIVPQSMQGKLYSTTMLAVLNSRMVTNMATEYTAWRDHELVFATLPPRCDADTLKLHLSTMAPLPNRNGGFVEVDATIIDIRNGIYSVSSRERVVEAV
ncbi:hypothetical protein BDN70DRAFT_990574 [Pholiota conissans]|uniref:DUF6534 domain-containing protein n=1 Tax=Pholiota conissans TaxID=109636 RepID=A0A9P5ZC65_9AGAR|nr:hypothetical protein BDN70DRAFT_990574 [Pholiota conissans]